MQRESLKLAGAAALDAQLAALGEKVATEIGRDAVVASAEALQNAWMAGAPYDPAGRGGAAKYGHLKANITIGPVRARNVHAVVWKVTTGDAFWGRMLEYGTVKMTARPWARPIVERMKSTLIQIQIAKLNERIEAVARSR